MLEVWTYNWGPSSKFRTIAMRGGQDFSPDQAEKFANDLLRTVAEARAHEAARSEERAD